MTNAFAVKVVLSTDFEYLGKNTEIYAYTCQHRAAVRGGENRKMDREPEYRHNGQIGAATDLVSGMTNCYKNIKNKGRTALRAILSLLMYERPENNPAAYGQFILAATAEEATP